MVTLKGNAEITIKPKIELQINNYQFKINNLKRVTFNLQVRVTKIGP